MFKVAAGAAWLCAACSVLAHQPCALRHSLTASAALSLHALRWALQQCSDQLRALDTDDEALYLPQGGSAGWVHKLFCGS